MSHSVTYVLVEPRYARTPAMLEARVEELLAPFDENMEVPRYKDRLSDDDRQSMAEHYKIDADDSQALLAKLQDWSGCEGGLDEEGLFKWRTYNPKSRWDWYQIGGRWNGWICGLELNKTNSVEGNYLLVEELLPHIGIRSTPEEFERRKAEYEAEEFKRRLPAFERSEADRTPFAILTPDGEWAEQGKMGWWGCVSDERPALEWCDAAKRILEKYLDHMAVAVDVHI